MIKVFEDGPRLLPGVAGSIEVSGGVVGVAEVGEGGGFVVEATEVAE